MLDVLPCRRISLMWAGSPIKMGPLVPVTPSRTFRAASPSECPRPAVPHSAACVGGSGDLSFTPISSPPLYGE